MNKVRIFPQSSAFFNQFPIMSMIDVQNLYPAFHGGDTLPIRVLIRGSINCVIQIQKILFVLKSKTEQTVFVLSVNWLLRPIRMGMNAFFRFFTCSSLILYPLRHEFGKEICTISSIYGRGYFCFLKWNPGTERFHVDFRYVYVIIAVCTFQVFIVWFCTLFVDCAEYIEKIATVVYYGRNEKFLLKVNTLYSAFQNCQKSMTSGIWTNTL